MTPPVAPEQQRLVDAMAGTWLGEETLFPSPWDPTGGTAIGRTQARAALEGQVVTSDYAEERDGRIVFRGHGVYTWDVERQAYCMFWFDSMAPAPRVAPALGTWDEGVLTFRLPGADAEHRYVYDFREPGYYVFRIEIERVGAPVQTFMSGEYVRQ